MIAKTLLASIASIMLIASANAEYDVAKYCELVTSGTKLPSFTSCQEYYVCADKAIGKPIKASCTGTTVFSKNAQSCVPQTSSTCSYDLDNPCKFKNNEFAPSAQGCNMWNYCVNGAIAGFGSCKLGQIFDPYNNSCVYGDCNDNNDDVLHARSICEIMPDGQFFGDFKDCRAWKKCSGLSLKKGVCPNDLVFDTKTGMCLKNDGNMCQRTDNVVKNLAGGPPSEACTSVDQIVGDTKMCSIYYTCQATSLTPTPTYQWVENSCYNQFFDVITKQCNDTSLARSYPGCDRCQFTSGNPHWVNAVSSTCSEYITCSGGQKAVNSQGSCGPNNYFNQDSQYCIEGDNNLKEYAMHHGACQGYSCTDARVCSMAGEGGKISGGTGEAATGENAGSPGGNGGSPAENAGSPAENGGSPAVSSRSDAQYLSKWYNSP